MSADRAALVAARAADAAASTSAPLAPGCVPLTTRTVLQARPVAPKRMLLFCKCHLAAWSGHEARFSNPSSTKKNLRDGMSAKMRPHAPPVGRHVSWQAPRASPRCQVDRIIGRVANLQTTNSHRHMLLTETTQECCSCAEGLHNRFEESLQDSCQLRHWTARLTVLETVGYAPSPAPQTGLVRCGNP